MKKVEVQLEYISFFKDEVKLKFTFFDGAKKQQLGKFIYDYKNATDYIKIKESFDAFVAENEFIVAPDVNVVLSTNEVFNTSLILPKAAASKVAKFVDNDLLDKFGVDYKKKYRTASIVSKYKEGGLCICTSLISNDLIRTITDILTTIGLRVKNLTSGGYQGRPSGRGDHRQLGADHRRQGHQRGVRPCGDRRRSPQP